MPQFFDREFKIPSYDFSEKTKTLANALDYIMLKGHMVQGRRFHWKMPRKVFNKYKSIDELCFITCGLDYEAISFFIKFCYNIFTLNCRIGSFSWQKSVQTS